MDFIVKLLVSNGFNTILTITDHDCTKAMILLPCREEIDALGVAKLYLRHMFPIVGLPQRVISDRDIRFTFKVFREVCSLLEVKQSVASAYHPQTDSQCYGAAPTQGQRSLVNDQGGLGAVERKIDMGGFATEA